MKQIISILCLLCLFVANSHAGGSWLVDGEAVQTPGADPNALYTDGSRSMKAPLAFDASVSSPNNGLFRAWFEPEGAYVDLLVLDGDEEVLWISSSPNVAFRVGDMFISQSSLINLASGTSVAFEDHMLGGGWKIDSVMNDPLAILNRTFSDNRYHQRSSITTPLVFDSSLSSPVNGLFKAHVPWDSQYDFFAFNSSRESVVLSPTVAIGFEAGQLVMSAGKLELPGEASIDFTEHNLVGGWITTTVMNDPYAIMNRSYADSRYIQRTEGINTNYTLQAGDVLQIQNGIVTAINP